MITGGAPVVRSGFAVSGRKKKSPSQTEQESSVADVEAEARQLELESLRGELAAQYREELLAHRREIASQSGNRNTESPDSGVKRWLDDKTDGDVRDFIKTFSEKKEQRKYQLSLIKEYLLDPSKFGTQSDVIPTSTTVEEFEQRKRELNFRIALVKTVLALAEEELRVLLQAEKYAHEKDEAAPPA